MSSVTTGKSAGLDETVPPPSLVKAIFLSPWLWGPLLTVAFCQAMPHLAEHREILTRYVFGRLIFYSQTTLFFFAVAILLRKAIGLIPERRALKRVVIDSASLQGIELPADRARSLSAAAANVPVGLRGTKLVERIRAACEYVARRDQSAALEDHLRYLADLAVENLTASFAAVRTITWGVPVLGALGTILSITLAFQSVDPDNLDASVAGAVADLGGAFDPTALSLAMSAWLVFTRLAVERAEGRVLVRVEQFGIEQLAPCFGGEVYIGPVSPLAGAEGEAAVKLVEKTGELIELQTGLWQQALEDLRRRWVETAQQQQAQFAAALEQGMAGSLADHAGQLAETRADFLESFRAVGLELGRITAGLQQMGEEHENLFHQQVVEVWEKMQTQMAAAQSEHQEHLGRSVALLDKAVKGWHGDLSAGTAALASQLQELQRQRETLHEVAGQEQELVRLQTTLTQNLQAVRAIEAFEESIHSLNAAVHMLTMRTKAHAA